MKLRHVLIMAILVFLNGFVFTVLLLMLSRELAHPAATPTTAVAVGPTFQPTFTSTPVGPPPTPTLAPTATSVPEATPTNTLVIGPPTATHTSTPVPPTATTGPATATYTPGGPTATSPPPTATPTTPPSSPTPQPSATLTTPSSYEFKYAGGMQSAPNCGTVYMKGKITGVGGEPVNGRTVRLRFAGNESYKVSGEGENPGEWGFSPLAPENYHAPFTFLVDIVSSQSNPAPQSDTVTINFTDCSVAGQFTDILFAYVTGDSGN
jgi:hypothetical protein